MQLQYLALNYTLAPKYLFNCGDFLWPSSEDTTLHPSHFSFKHSQNQIPTVEKKGGKRSARG